MGNNLLHGSVEHIIQMVVSGDCSILKAALFEDCDFLNRILKARELSAQHQEKSGFRLGYMGHITRVSNTIVEFAKRNDQLMVYMNANDGWIKFIADELKLENEQLNTQLGGHRPTAMLGGDDNDDEFTLFTLNDITTDNNNDGDLLGANYDNNSDSDSDSNDSNDDNDIDENNDKKDSDQYELPQDAFSRLTETIDQLQNENENQPITDTKKEKTEDFDNWFNDDESWNDFGNDNDKKKEDQPNDKKEQELQPKDNDNDNDNDNDKGKNNDNWDNDPFADDLFGNDEEI